MAASDAKPFPIYGQAFRVYAVILDADGDPVSGITGADSEVSKDGGSYADCESEFAEIGTSGSVYLDLSATEMTAYAVTLQLKCSNAGAKTTTLVLYPATATRGLAGTALPAAAADAAGGLSISDAGGLDLDVKLAHTEEITAARLAYLDAAISSRSTYAGADPAGVTTLLARLTATRAGLLDYLDAAISTVKAKTDALPSDPADQSLIIAATDALMTAINLRLLASAYTTPPTVGAIADQVWDEAISGHLGAGSTGNALSTASSGGVDPAALADAVCDEALAGHTTAGTLGKKIADLANADLSGLATATALGTVDTVVDAIKAKTDALPTDPADASDIAAALGAIDTLIDGVKVKTDLIPAEPAAVGSAMTLTAGTLTAIAAAVPVQARKNTALAKFAVPMVNSTTKELMTGLAVTFTRSIDGGAFAAGTLANSAEVGVGIYSVDFGAADLNGAVIVLRATAPGADDTFVTIPTART